MPADVKYRKTKSFGDIFAGCRYVLPMKQQEVRSALIHYIREQAKPTDKFSHQTRLYQIAKQLAGTEKFDDDVLFAAAWLHDLGVFVGHRPENLEELARWDNVAYAMEKAPSVLRELGFPESKIPAVVETIRTHLPSREPTSVEGHLLRDADILEQLGAMAILRTVSKVGRDTRFVRFADALRTLRKNADDLPGRLRLASSRGPAEERLKILRAFLETAEAESGGGPPEDCL
jgi:uncharacterized protein